ncbi:MAG: DNA topoisomerase I [Agathobaculum butyriciproducens]
MVQRSVCLCDGKYIGIESIFTVIDGKQINIPDKLSALRTRSRKGELFCPCGCGANLILVAGDRNLRAQHFRLKDSARQHECTAETERPHSIYSKIVLKCWLDEKLNVPDVETRVPICLVGDTARKYEFSFVSRTSKLAVSYSCNRANLSDEKMEILRANSSGIRLIYIVDALNSCGNGQYPEALMKVQERQGYCLLLDVEEMEYSTAKLSAVFYAQDCTGLWREIEFAAGALREFSISEYGRLLYQNAPLAALCEWKKSEFEREVQQEKIWREQQMKELLERPEREQKQRPKRTQTLPVRRPQNTKSERQRAMEKLVHEKEEAGRRAQKKQREEAFRQTLAEQLNQQETQVIDPDGNRWVKCRYCGRVDKTTAFSSYGGRGSVNLGTCKICDRKPVSERRFIQK